MILLAAPVRSLSIAMGENVTSWFDYTNLNFLKKIKEGVNFEHVEEAKDTITQAIDEEVENHLGGDYSKIFI